MKINLVSFYTEGEPNDLGINLSETKNIFIENAQNNVANISLYTPKILKSMGYDYHVKNYENIGVGFMNPRCNNMGFFAWKPLIMLLELEKMNDGEILVYRDMNSDKYPQLKNFDNFEQIIYNTLTIVDFDFFIPFDPYGLYNENICKTAIIKELGENHKFSYKYPCLIANFIIVRKSKISIELLKEWLKHCENEKYINGEIYEENVPEFSRSTNEQSILCVIIANWIRYKKYNISNYYPKLVLIDRDITKLTIRPEFNYLKYLNIKKFTNNDNDNDYIPIITLIIIIISLIFICLKN